MTDLDAWKVRKRQAQPSTAGSGWTQPDRLAWRRLRCCLGWCQLLCKFLGLRFKDLCIIADHTHQDQDEDEDHGPPAAPAPARTGTPWQACGAASSGGVLVPMDGWMTLPACLPGCGPIALAALPVRVPPVPSLDDILPLPLRTGNKKNKKKRKRPENDAAASSKQQEEQERARMMEDEEAGGTGGALGRGVRKAFRKWLKNHRQNLSKDTRAHYCQVRGLGRPSLSLGGGEGRKRGRGDNGCLLLLLLRLLLVVGGGWCAAGGPHAGRGAQAAGAAAAAAEAGQQGRGAADGVGGGGRRRTRTGHRSIALTPACLPACTGADDWRVVDGSCPLT